MLSTQNQLSCCCCNRSVLTKSESQTSPSKSEWSMWKLLELATVSIFEALNVDEENVLKQKWQQKFVLILRSSKPRHFCRTHYSGASYTLGQHSWLAATLKLCTRCCCFNSMCCAPSPLSSGIVNWTRTESTGFVMTIENKTLIFHIAMLLNNFIWASFECWTGIASNKLLSTFCCLVSECQS